MTFGESSKLAATVHPSFHFSSAEALVNAGEVHRRHKDGICIDETFEEFDVAPRLRCSDIFAALVEDRSLCRELDANHQRHIKAGRVDRKRSFCRLRDCAHRVRSELLTLIASDASFIGSRHAVCCRRERWPL